MLAVDVVKAFCLGVCAAIPIGPVAFFVLQKTLCKGRKVGLVTGIGSTVVDTAYAGFSIFAIGLIMDMITRYQSRILMIGGVIVIAVGLRMFMSRHDFSLVTASETRSRTAAGYALQCAACALANPGAVAMILAIVAVLGIHAENLSMPVWAVLPFVAAGEFSYWALFTFLADKLRHAMSPRFLNIINRTAAVAVVILGIVLLVKGITEL